MVKFEFTDEEKQLRDIYLLLLGNSGNVSKHSTEHDEKLHNIVKEQLTKVKKVTESKAADYFLDWCKAPKHTLLLPQGSDSIIVKRKKRDNLFLINIELSSNNKVLLQHAESNGYGCFCFVVKNEKEVWYLDDDSNRSKAVEHFISQLIAGPTYNFVDEFKRSDSSIHKAYHKLSKLKFIEYGNDYARNVFIHYLMQYRKSWKIAESKYFVDTPCSVEYHQDSNMVSVSTENSVIDYKFDFAHLTQRELFIVLIVLQIVATENANKGYTSTEDEIKHSCEIAVKLLRSKLDCKNVANYTKEYSLEDDAILRLAMDKETATIVCSLHYADSATPIEYEICTTDVEKYGLTNVSNFINGFIETLLLNVDSEENADG